MISFPLQQLRYYRTKKKLMLTTPVKSGEPPQTVEKDTVLQYTKSISNIQGMMELVHFTERDTGRQIVWEIRVEEIYDCWDEYLERVE